MTNFKEQKTQRLVAKDVAVSQAGVPFGIDLKLPDLILLNARHDVGRDLNQPTTTAISPVVPIC